MVTSLKKIVLNPNDELRGFHLIQVQENVSLVFNQILNTQFMNGVFIENINLVSGSDNTVNHGLDRNPLGFIVVLKNANADVWESPSGNNFRIRQIFLRSSANVKVTLYLF